MKLGSKGFKYANGTFEWDHWSNGIIFISNETIQPEKSMAKKIAQTVVHTSGYKDITFREDIDITDKVIFNRFFRRKIKLIDAHKQCILLQDVKDVVLFTSNIKQLSLEFIHFLHTPTVDCFLRALIVYFQLYFQIWDKLMIRREEMQMKIMQPIVTELENIERDNLADLRSMVSREFSSLLFGAKDSKVFHHMNNKNHVSLSDKDRRLYELLIKVSTRIVWYALHKPSLSIIEMETDRITRSNYFNKFIHQYKKTKKILTFPNEERILRGVGDIAQSKLGSQSPVVKENLKADHDHRMLAIGQVDFPPSDDRLRFLEALYLVPEDRLSEFDICVGILGMPRDEFDVMLKQKRKKTKDDEDSKPPLVFELYIPPRVEHSVNTIPSAYPRTLPRFQTSPEQKRITRTQCKMWLNRVERSLKADELHLDPTVYSTYSTDVFM